METSTVIYIILGLLAYVYLYFKRKFSYWQRMGVPFIEPSIPLGNIQGFRRKFHSSELMQKFYNHFKASNERFGGLYFFTKPAILILDLDLIKWILIRDFDRFQDRGMFYNEKDDPLSAHLFSLEGKKWRDLRAKLTPTFTSGRMKFMFSTIVEVGNEFHKTLSSLLTTQTEVELKELLARYTTDVIGTCAFGIECNSLKDPNAQFRRMGKKVFEVPKNSALKQMFMLTFKKLAHTLRMTTTDEEVSEFFMRIVKETVAFREQKNVQRNDFMDLLMQLKKTGRLNGEQAGGVAGTLTIEEIAAQAFVFFLAGFETSSTVMTYCIYELALNQAIQDKARETIDEVLERHGSFTYEAMIEMTYIDQIINESLRKYPPGANLIRNATKDYLFPGTLGSSRLDKGCSVWIPVYAIHHDPDIYPNPEIFDPERFTSEAVGRRHPQAFLPFGDGPRNCIGLRFGMMQTRVGLVTLLKHFRFKTCSKTNIPLTFSKRSVILSPEGGLWLNIEQI